MAMPAAIDEQLTQQRARLRLVPADEAPPSEDVREQVRRWEEHLQWAADAIRWIDGALAELPTLHTVPEADRQALAARMRETRAEAFAVIRRLNPDQAWFWTESWQAGEREADADEAAGRTTYHASTENFLAALDAHLDDESESDDVAHHADARGGRAILARLAPADTGAAPGLSDGRAAPG